MPFVRLNRMVAIALLALAAPALAGPRAARRETAPTTPSSTLSPVLRVPVGPAAGGWWAGSDPRRLRSLPEHRPTPAQPKPVFVPVSGAVALMDVEPSMVRGPRPRGLTVMLMTEDDPVPATSQSNTKSLLLMPQVDRPAPQLLTPGQ